MQLCKLDADSKSKHKLLLDRHSSRKNKERVDNETLCFANPYFSLETILINYNAAAAFKVYRASQYGHSSKSVKP